jgi:hypothetical protein
MSTSQLLRDEGRTIVRVVPRWAVAWVIIGIGVIAALAVSPVTPPADRRGLRSFLIVIDPSTTVSQTFVMNADQFYGIEVSATGTTVTPSGDVQFDLYDVTDHRVVRSVSVPAAEVVGRKVYRFEFPPIARESREHFYRLNALVSPSQPAHGVAFRATKGDGYAGGALFINDRERWADLTFATLARGGRSPWRRLLDASAAQPRRYLAQIVITALLAYWVALGIVLRSWWHLSARPSA